ncbi:MAG TPA: pyridoxal phosphate-dependent aminotransferase [Candidatus Mediterraneibacter intestinipullorum]|nr:pyridoxal phosphate-dependent aminotransferase [Candidatus Mediterraneibacter intestinipullorum]
MKYNFDLPVNRRGTYSLKWDVPENELPMWVADMDFETAPEIREAIMRRASHGIFGYTAVPEEWYWAIGSWWQERYHFCMEKDWVIFCTGVVPAISSIVRKMTDVGEKIVLLTPVYNIFFNSIVNNGRYVIESALRYENGGYSIDLPDLEEKLADPQATMMIFCNPHNPIGKIWDRDTLEKVGELCEKYHVLVVSDEIHCDLTDPGREYLPFASVSESCRNNSITCIAPTKTFNLAGLQTAAVVVPDGSLRHKVWRGLNTDEVAEPNVFAVTAAIAAWEKGAPWLEELRAYLFENKCAAAKFIQTQIPEVSLVRSEATYLLWLDCRKVTENDKKLAGFLRAETGLYLCAGSEYGKAGRGFLRMNIACTREVLEEGLTQLKRGIRILDRQEGGFKKSDFLK